MSQLLLRVGMHISYTGVTSLLLTGTVPISQGVHFKRCIVITLKILTSNQ